MNDLLLLFQFAFIYFACLCLVIFICLLVSNFLLNKWGVK